MKPRISSKMSAILAWAFGFIFAETLGVIIAIVYGNSSPSSGAVGNAVTVSSRLASLALISQMSSFKLKEAVDAPSLKTAFLPTMIAGAAVSFGSSYFVNAFQLQLVGLSYFIRNGVPWAFPIQISYYISEIVVLNYMYLTASKGWGWHRGPIRAGTLFLIVGWASLHAITKDVLVAVYGVALVLTLYVSYEYAKSPLTPVILWFVSLMA